MYDPHEICSKWKKLQFFGEEQIHLLLGDAGRSFVVGFGNNPPKYAYHIAAACPKDPSNPIIVYGALVSNYKDEKNWANRVLLYGNAGFQATNTI